MSEGSSVWLLKLSRIMIEAVTESSVTEPTAKNLQGMRGTDPEVYK